MASISLPPYGQHLVFLGATGSGKTFLAETMLRYYESILAINSQDSLELKGFEVKNPNSLNWSLPLCKKLIYTPKPEFLDKHSFNYVFKKFLESSSKKKPNPRICYIDEIYHCGYGNSFPQWLPKGLATARQKQLSFWISTQRPKAIPIPVLTEASKIFVFFLNREDDIKYVSGFARKDQKGFMQALYEQTDDHSFIVIDARKGEWEKYPKLKV
jgi:hypothetical protein